MWREDCRVVLDFAGTDPQSNGSINFLLNENMMRMFSGIYMIMVFDPQILFNDGYYDLIDIRIPEGSLLKPAFPAALSGRTHALGRLFDILGGLLGDGPDGHSLWPNFTNVPNEFLECYFPLMIERYETVPDSGGAGLHRGGNGILMTYKFLEPGLIAIHDGRWLTYPWGVNGGAPGARARKVLRRAGGSEEIVGNKREDMNVEAGDELDFITWGGGWCDPLERAPEVVAKEVRQGLVTVSGARAYGVLIADGAVDAAGTDALRGQIRGERGNAIPLFNYGPSIDDLRSQCKAETGLDAPKAPLRREPELAVAAE